MSKLLLAGYFGSGNLGDDAILLGFARGIEPHGHEFKVVAGSAERLMRNYGLIGISKTEMDRVKTAIKECDALVFPGGSIFQDVTSVRSVAYYSNLVKLAKKENKKVIMLGQGIGPLNRFIGKSMAVSAFNSCDAIAVRDPQSINTLRSLGVKVNPQLTADTAFLLQKPELKEESSSFGVAGMKTIGISMRPFGKEKETMAIFTELIKKLHGAGYVPTMVNLDETEDQPLVTKMAKTYGGKLPELRGVNHPIQLMERLSRMEAIIGMRLHSGILASIVGVPPYLLSYDPKVSAFANVMGFSTPLPMEGITADRIFNGFQTFIKDRDRIAESIVKRSEEQRKLSQGNIDLLNQTLG
ncbi:MAG: polysaccharide pyruvyl transferase CsaB [Armatimonadetes bacterium]|nr:polysaccharide pyruvyl transferase CsaB [Armatimonadota bacterium]